MGTLSGYLTYKPDLLNVRNIDIGCLPLLTEMERVGTAINIPGLQSLGVELTDSMREYESKIRKHIPVDKLRELLNKPGDNTPPSKDDPDSYSSDKTDDTRDPDLDKLDLLSGFNVNSSEKVAWLLFDILGLGRGKSLKTSGDGKRISTGKKQLEMLKDEHEVVGLLLKYREVSKLKTTYVDKLPKMAVFHNKGLCTVCGLRHREGTNRIHTQFPTTRTETGRPASRSPNLQNIPARTDLGKRVRANFIPTPGLKWVSVDESQIELRALAHCAREETMLQIYRDKKDIHIETARKAFGLGPDDPVDPDMHRAPSKTVNFGVVYGMSAAGLFAQLVFMFHFASKPVPSWLTEQWCQEFIERWFSTYPMVRGYMQRIYRMLRRYGFVWNEFGFVRQIHAIWSVHRHLQSEAERQAGNMPIQGFAAILMKLWMNLVLGTHEGEGWLPEWRELGECNPLLTVHDELNFETDPAISELVKEVLAELVEFIGTELGLLCPLMAEGKVMDYWKK